jgi:pimeloyl-ACP methyl ester carboxylesterase
VLLAGAACGAALVGGSVGLGAPRPAEAQQKKPKRPGPDLGLPDLDLVELVLPGDKKLGERCVLLTPKHLAAGKKVPLVVLLHGLGETGDQVMGSFAWVERYGLASSYARLRRPPVERTTKRKDFTDDRLAFVQGELKKRPFEGLAFVCPYTPNASKQPSPVAALDAYAKWLGDVVIPRARQHPSVLAGASSTAIVGCSMGGPISLEVFARRPASFAAWGGVQSAFSGYRASHYAERLVTAKKVAASPAGGGPSFLLLSSQGDDFKQANVELDRELGKRGAQRELLVLPGPHDQPWLREAGTLETLLFFERRLTPKKP